MTRMHPDLAFTIAKLRHDELTGPRFHGDVAGRPRRRFFRRRRDSVTPPVSRSVDLVALPPPREGREVDERRVA